MNRLLCLDGPLNGQYATPGEAIAAGYWRSTWAGTGEEVWEHGAPGTTQDEPASAAFEDS